MIYIHFDFAVLSCFAVGTVFAYGQTNSGKTHTMRGSTTEPGIIPLSVRDLFKTIQQVLKNKILLKYSNWNKKLITRSRNYLTRFVIGRQLHFSNFASYETNYLRH